MIALCYRNMQTVDALYSIYRCRSYGYTDGVEELENNVLLRS